MPSANREPFVMEYDGVCHYAVAEYDARDRECYMLLLDENKQPYYNAKGEKIGYYKASSQGYITLLIRIYSDPVLFPQQMKSISQ